MKNFIFESYSFNAEKKELTLNYSFDSKMFFSEKITFVSDKILNIDEIGALNNVFKYLHLIAGISYYKLFLPSNIIIKTVDLNKKQADFFNEFYLNGLGEFLCRNNIKNAKNIIKFPYKKNVINRSIDLKLSNKYCIPVGGGKDSIVSIEILKKSVNNDDIVLGSVNTAKSIEDTIKIAGLKSFIIKREISPKLIEINNELDKYGAYNGHVPITGILAFILCAGAIFYDYGTVLVSNERSANVGNVKFDNMFVNHQWSKSFQCEKMLNNFFKNYVINDFEYLSFLRPLSEIHIAKIFSKLNNYHNIFKSCNKNFKINGRITNWCCDCDKCRFVFLILAVFLKKDKMIEIFGTNILDDERQMNGYLELVGLKNFKPFECVGEVSECIYAFRHINETFFDSIVVKRIRPLIADLKINKNVKLFDLNNKHLLNNKLLSMLISYLK